jgi:hypothetical protein
VVIKPAATVTVAAGTTLRFAADTSLRVEGTLDAQGSAGSLVTMAPAVSGARWGGVSVASGGSATLAFVDLAGAARGLTCEIGASGCVIEDSYFHGNIAVGDFKAPGSVSRSKLDSDGAITFDAGADVTITDTSFTGVTGDLLVMAGGRLEITYSEIGAISSTEHCGFHVDAAEALVVTNNVIHNQPYGFMIGNIDGAVITGNNFIDNGTDIQDMGGTANTNATGNYWSGGAPLMPGYDTSGEALDPLMDVGPR